MSETQRLELTVFGESLRLKAEAGEIERLRRAADYVEERIRAFQEAGAGSSNVRLAVLAALDAAHELMRERDGAGSHARQRATDVQAAAQRLDRLVRMIDEALPKT